jgi:predicted phage tail protein
MRLIFHGELRKKFGRSFDLQANSIAEALDGFSRQVDWPSDMPVQVLGHRSDESLLECPEEVHIVPALRGGSGKWFNILIGAVLLVAGVIVGGTLGLSLIINGGLMILSGIVQLFMKAPKYNKSNDPEASKYVSVNRNTTAIGTPMTMAWGRIDLGGHWLSLQSDSNQLSYGVFPATPT